MWSISVVDSAMDVGWDTSLVLDGADHPHISYNSESEKILKYAYWNGSAWIIQKVADLPDVGWGTSIALFQGAIPYIAFHDEPSYDLKLAIWR